MVKFWNVVLAIALVTAIVLYGVLLHQHDVEADKMAKTMTQEQWNRIH